MQKIIKLTKHIKTDLTIVIGNQILRKPMKPVDKTLISLSTKNKNKK